MAFNFNWTPLSTTSSEFYTRAKDLLTAALNKAPKPPIIVDDIIVEELNLGTTAPELEILEIGDLAEDRFRGIFKISYGGDAELTLKTKVQANPLSTYLSTTPSFTSPRPLAASAPLTIPLQITLSQFRLSGFVILVFSKAKGITLVFRNDPLESLRVSSTFDSIPFIKDYLQKEIERVVRGLFQEELPVGIHRLSLKWFNPDYAASLEAENANIGSGQHQAAHSSNGDSEDEGESNSRFINPLAASSDESLQQQFSTKNLAEFEKLARSQKTFNVGGPGIEDVVYRAWAAPSVVPAWSNGGLGWTEPPGTPAGERAASTTYTFDDRGEAVISGSSSTRPSLVSTASSMSVNGGMGSASSVNGARMNGRGRKKKHRIVNLRRKTQPETAESVSGSSESTMDLGSMTSASSAYGEEYPSTREGSVIMDDEQDPAIEQQQYQYNISHGGSMRRTASHKSNSLELPSAPSSAASSRPTHIRETRRMAASSTFSSTTSSHPQLRQSVPSTPLTATAPMHHVHQAQNCGCPHVHPLTNSMPMPPNPWLTLATMVGAAGNGGNGSGVLEQAVLMKLAGEVARLQAKERDSKGCGGVRRREEDEELGEAEAPPAYGA